MHHHAGCELASDWLPMPSLAKKVEPFFHLQLTLGRGNTSRTILFILPPWSYFCGMCAYIFFLVSVAVDGTFIFALSAPQWQRLGSGYFLCLGTLDHGHNSVVSLLHAPCIIVSMI